MISNPRALFSAPLQSEEGALTRVEVYFQRVYQPTTYVGSIFWSTDSRVWKLDMSLGNLLDEKVGSPVQEEELVLIQLLIEKLIQEKDWSE